MERRILQRLRRAITLDRLLNVLLIAAGVLFVGMLAKWNAVRHSRPERGSVMTGKKLDVAQVRWDGVRQTVVFALSTNCHFCTESAPFYRQFIHDLEARSGARIMAAFPQSIQESRAYLRKVDLPIDEVYQSNFMAQGVFGTPTVLLVNGAGVITTTWVGKPDSSQQAAMLEAVGRLSAGKASGHNDVRVQTTAERLGDKSAMPLEKDAEVDAALLKRMIDGRKKLVLLDIDPRDKFQRDHVPSARNIPIDELETRAENELNQQDKIVLYCRCTNDSTSRIASELLASLGYKHVSILRGGLGEWRKAGQKPASASAQE